MKIFFLLTAFLLSSTAFSQRFQPGHNGHISDPAFKTFLKGKGYVFCSAYEVRNYGEITAAVYTGKVWKEIDLDGQEIKGAPDVGPGRAVSDNSYGVGEPSQSGQTYAEPPSKLSDSDALPSQVRAFEIGSRYGVLSAFGDTLLPAKYAQVEPLSKKAVKVKTADSYFLLCQNESQSWGFSNGYAEIRELKENSSINYFYIVKCDGQYGLIDNLGKELISPKYEGLNVFDEKGSMLYAVKDGKTGLIKLDGTMVIPLEFDNIFFSPTREAIFAATGSQNSTNREVTIFSPDGKLKSKKYSGMYMIDTQIGSHYSVASGYGNDMKVGLFDVIDMKEDVAPKYDFIGEFSKGRINNALVTLETENGLMYGFINRTGKEVIIPQYDFATKFENGRALVKNKGKWGIIGIKSDTIVALKYDSLKVIIRDAASDSDKLSYAFLADGKWGVLSSKAVEIIPAVYDEVSYVSDGFLISAGALKGIAGTKGNILVKPIYASLRERSKGVYSCQRNGKLRMADLYGGEIEEVQIRF